MESSSIPKIIIKKKKIGGEGHRSPYLSHAKRALYHLSYTPVTTKYYGFDFEGKSSFIKATTGASFYNLTIKGIGKEASAATQLNQAFVDNANLTSFENMMFENCYLTTEINENNFNVGVVANKMLGGFLNNISVQNVIIQRMNL